MVKKKYVCIPRSFLVINVCNQGKTLSSPCTTVTLCIANAEAHLSVHKHAVLTELSVEV